MLLLSDNDIILKLFALDLFDDFLSSVSISREDVYITTTARYSLKEQAKKKGLEAGINELIGDFSIIDNGMIDIDILEEIQGHNVDSGEAILASCLIKKTDCYMATGDKRFLNAMKKSNHVEHFYNRVFTFESSLKKLCICYGYDYIKNKILSSSVGSINVDTLFRMAFKDGSTEQSDLECLDSYSRDILEFLSKS